MLTSLFRPQKNTKQLPDDLFWYAKFDLKSDGTPQNNELAAGFEIHKAAYTDSEKLIVAGDIWLSNRRELNRRFDLDESTDDLHAFHRLWETLKETALEHVQGSYALLVFEREFSKLKLIRDPVGTKNLYYAKDSSSFYVAARIKAISSFVSKEIDELALRDYLCCAFVPGEQTMFRSIREVRPGEIVELPGKTIKSFWKIREDFQEFESESLEWHSERLRKLLEEVIDEYLPANEDAGCYISGGIDSSAVAALAANLHSKKVDCYSIHFGSECPNELEWSGMVAKHCGLTQHIIEITPDDMWNLHPEVISMLDDPIGDPLTVPNMILAQKAKMQTNVILNGEGGDPCFGGPKNQPMMLDSLYREKTASRAEIEAAYLSSFQKCKTDLSRLLNSKLWNSVKEKESVFADDLTMEGHYVNKFFLINTKYKGADQILSKVNNITSCFQLAGRSPLFDRRIVDASLTIPPQHKLKGTQEKAVLKYAVSDLLPEAILQRPKSGMMVPVQLGFRKYWQKQARKLLLNKKAHIREFLNMQVVGDWLDYKEDVWARYGVKLWLLSALELWLRENL